MRETDVNELWFDWADLEEEEEVDNEIKGVVG